MTRYIHYFDMPVTGSFESDEEDFENALTALHHDKTTKQAVELMVAHSEVFYSFQNIEPTDMPSNPEIIK